MGEIHDYIAGSIAEYLRDELSLEEFRVAFASAYFHARQHPYLDLPLVVLMNKLIGPFAEFSAGHKPENYLRLELANAIRPFVVTPIPVRSEPVSSWGSRIYSLRIDQGGSGKFRPGSWPTHPASTLSDFLIRVGER
jgi:hypothetical protein